jgi:hypothetical protein
MTIKEIINLDCRVKENKESIQRALRKIKPLSNYSEDSFRKGRKACMEVIFEIQDEGKKYYA